MLRRRLVVQVGGQPVHAAADYLLARNVAQVSQGCFLEPTIGHHR
jgi:hypothetical protein